MSEPLHFEAAPLRRRELSWIPIGISALLHTLIILTLLFHPIPVTPLPVQASDASEAKQLMVLPPLPKPKAAQPPPPPPPSPQAEKDPPKKDTPLGPDSRKPDEPPKEKGPERPLPDPDQIDAAKKLADAAPPVPKPTPDKSTDPSSTADPATVRFIPGPSETSKLLSPPVSPWARTLTEPVDAPTGKSAAADAKPNTSVAMNSSGRYGFDPGAMSNMWQPSFKDPAGQCVKIPDLGVDANGKPVLATVQGRVFWEDHHTPLAGAQLQIVGTSYTTFSDNTGEYTLHFDPHMLEKCHTAYVRVRATGFRGALLTLAVGERIRSDDVILRRN